MENILPILVERFENLNKDLDKLNNRQIKKELKDIIKFIKQTRRFVEKK